MSTLGNVLTAVQIVAPLVRDVAEWIRTGKEPQGLTTLPTTLRSRVAFEKMRRAVATKGKP